MRERPTLFLGSRGMANFDAAPALRANGLPLGQLGRRC
jgi:hypothetical protein